MVERGIIVNPGKTLKHLIYIDDLCAAFESALHNTLPIGEAFIIAGPKPTPLTDLVAITARELEVPPARIDPGDLDEIDAQMMSSAQVAMERVGDSLYHTHFRAAITQAFALAQESNRYLDTKAPWRSIRTDELEAATALVVAIRVINCLKVALYPFLPFTSQRLHEFLGFDGKIEQEKWDFNSLVEAIRPGKALRQPRPLYTKLDPQLVEEETQRLGGQVV